LKDFELAPSAGKATALITYLSSQKTSNLEDIFHIYQQVPTPNVPVLGSLVNATRKLGQPHRASFIWDELVRHNITPSEMIFGSLIAAALETNNVSLAKILLTKFTYVCILRSSV
jgi:hypothetical protein